MHRRRLGHSKPGLTIDRRAFLFQMAGAGFAANAVLRQSAGTATKSQSQSQSQPIVDPYAAYLQMSPDFRPVRQDPAWLRKAFSGWIYLPWSYQWNIGYTDASGKWSRDHGYNGAFLDGNGESPDSPPGKLAWIDNNRLKFYMDHTAGKHLLHLWDGGQQKAHLKELDGGGVRTVPINYETVRTLKKTISNNISQVKSSPERAAYALDDEISWGHFVHPAMWCVTDDPAQYKKWLRQIYGDSTPERAGWITYEDIRSNLPNWRIQDFDASPLMDQWTFNDSVWCNLIGDLVEHANSVDADTPCGIVGGQAPNAFGGYDYARLMRKIQFIEAYNLGSSQAIIRSFNPHNAIPAVTSHFHKSVPDDIWQVWYYLAHGNRGHIGWVEDWFDGTKPKSWHDDLAPHYIEAAKRISPLLADAEWKHDGVALYYSHPSIQLGWILDAEAHGKTWINRDNDHRLGASHLVRLAWENMFRDSGLQYSFLSYIDVVQKGIAAGVKVLVLPACLCLSLAEAKIISAFCEAGGTVIADYLPGLWDQHGRGRAAGGCLDTLFGVTHSSKITSRDLFGGKLWCEVDQDANYEYRSYKAMLTNGSQNIMDAGGFNKAVRSMPTEISRKHGKGHAVLMNLSPQWYNAYRLDGPTGAARRDTFMKYVALADLKRWVDIETIGNRSPTYEITYFKRSDGRTVLFVCSNFEVTGNQEGGGNAAGLKNEAIDITLRFVYPVMNVRDERTGSDLGKGDLFRFRWNQNEAIVVSFDKLQN